MAGEGGSRAAGGARQRHATVALRQESLRWSMGSSMIGPARIGRSSIAAERTRISTATASRTTSAPRSRFPAIGSTRPFAADQELLNNSGETPNAPFKTGGCLDLMLGTTPPPTRSARVPWPATCACLLPVEGQAARAALPRRGPRHKEPVPFSPPWRTITIDRVDDLTAQLKLAAPWRRTRKARRRRVLRTLSAARRAWPAACGRANDPWRPRHPARQWLSDTAARLLEQQGDSDHRRRAERSRAHARALGPLAV